MPRPLTDFDIPLTGHLAMLAFDGEIQVDLFYWNGSIPREAVLIVKGRPNAYLGDTPAEAMQKAIDEYGGL